MIILNHCLRKNGLNNQRNLNQIERLQTQGIGNIEFDHISSISQCLKFQNDKANNKTILITGGAGFIGSHLVRLFVTKYPEYQVINLDALTYAGNLENLRDVESFPNYIFEKGDITRPGSHVISLFRKIFIRCQSFILLPKVM